MTRRVVVCPDKFAGTLTAAEAAAAIARGWRSVRGDDEIVTVPLADGGEGTVDVVAQAHPGAEVRRVEVADARGVATQAAWLWLPDGTAVVETAQACGLSALAADQRDPLLTTTYGVGQLLTRVLAATPSRVVVGLGGSATVDGGAGMVSALTVHGVRRADGHGVKIGGRWVADVASVRPVRLAGPAPEVLIASDVTSPLLGEKGAARIFGPQKGADADGVKILEAALANWADVVEAAVPGGPWRDLPGAGAAGGLGFALMAFLGGRVHSGAAVVADLVGLDVTGADVVITGEGSLDAQTLKGKAPEEARRRAAAAGAVTVAVAGVVQEGAGAAFDLVEPLGPDGPVRPFETAADAAAQVARRVRGAGPWCW